MPLAKVIGPITKFPAGTTHGSATGGRTGVNGFLNGGGIQGFAVTDRAVVGDVKNRRGDTGKGMPCARAPATPAQMRPASIAPKPASRGRGENFIF